MTGGPDFRAIEIDALDIAIDMALDTKLAETARRKRIPSLTLDVPASAGHGRGQGAEIPSERSGGGSPPTEVALIDAPNALPVARSRRKSERDFGAEPAHRPGEDRHPDGDGRADGARQPAPSSMRRRPLSLEVPDYLARELKVKAASEAVTVRFLVLSALAEVGYRVDPSELEEDGRRLR